MHFYVDICDKNQYYINQGRKTMKIFLNIRRLMIEKSQLEGGRKITNAIASEESGIPLATYARLASKKEDFYINSTTFKKLIEYFNVEPGGLFEAVDE
jgi:hypothetical protein